MRPIGPHEREYLDHPYMSAGEDLLYYAVQHLCFTSALDLHYWKVPAHPQNPHLVLRLFLTRRPDAKPATSAEAFVLDLFPEGRTIHLGELRAIINERMKEKDMGTFKSERVRSDLKSAGLVRFAYWLTAEGRAVRAWARQLLRTLESEVDTLMDHDPTVLGERLKELGSLVVMAHDDAREQLKKLKDVHPTWVRSLPSAPSWRWRPFTWTLPRCPAYPSAVGLAAALVEAEEAVGSAASGGGGFGGGGAGGSW